MPVRLDLGYTGLLMSARKLGPNDRLGCLPMLLVAFMLWAILIGSFFVFMRLHG